MVIMSRPNMACLEAMYKDITRLHGDHDTSDMVIKCGDEELRVHSFVMMARSPVFHRMLTTDMLEKKEKTVTVKDWQVEVVREMVNFMYTATISPNYSNLLELLAIGDKYCVSSLVTLCSALLASTIKPETALEMGVFGEMHSADELVDKCAMFISQDLDCLEDNWMERVKGSPKLTTGILQHIKEGRGKEVVVDRFKMTVRGTYGILGRNDSIQFKVIPDENLKNPMFLTSMGIYGTMQEEKLEVRVTILQDTSILTFFVERWTSDCSMTPHVVSLPHPMKVLPMTTYTVMQEVVGSGFIFQGHGGSSEVELTLPCSTKARVVFSKSPLSTNGTDVFRGAIPRLLFKTHN